MNNETKLDERTGILESNHIYKHITEVAKLAQKPLNYLHGILGFIVLTISAATLIGGGYFLNKYVQLTQYNTNQLELLNKYYVSQNQQTILLKVIDKNLRDSKEAKMGSAPLEEKVALAKVWYDLCSTKNVPINLLCGIAEIESSWNTHAISDMGCVGIIQVNPPFARSHLRENRIDYRKDIFFDPVVCSICGIGMLVDFQNDKIEKGLATPDNWNFSTHDYLWGPDRRGNIYDMNYSIKVLNAAKKYKEMGL